MCTYAHTYVHIRIRLIADDCVFFCVSVSLSVCLCVCARVTEGHERGVLVAEEVDACGTLGRAGVAQGDLVLALNNVQLEEVRAFFFF